MQPLLRMASWETTASLESQHRAAVMTKAVRQGNDSKEALLGTVPNALCTLRIVASPVAAWHVAQGDFVVGTCLFMACGLSDLVDGEIARTNPESQSSVLGSYLDPFADKVMVTSAMISLSYSSIISPIFAALVIARDVSLITAGFVIRARTKSKSAAFFSTTDSSSLQVEPTTLSKFNTMGLLMLISASCYSAALDYDFSSWAGPLQGVLGLTTLGSWYQYYHTYSNKSILHGVDMSAVDEKAKA